MSAEDVFNKMKSYHQQTGRVLSGGRFILEIVNKHDQRHVVEGLMLFNDYLDESREGLMRHETST